MSDTKLKKEIIEFTKHLGAFKIRIADPIKKFSIGKFMKSQVLLCLKQAHQLAEVSTFNFKRTSHQYHEF